MCVLSFYPGFAWQSMTFSKQKRHSESLEHNFQTHFETLTLRIRIKHISKTKKHTPTGTMNSYTELTRRCGSTWHGCDSDFRYPLSYSFPYVYTWFHMFPKLIHSWLRGSKGEIWIFESSPQNIDPKKTNFAFLVYFKHLQTLCVPLQQVQSLCKGPAFRAFFRSSFLRTAKWALRTFLRRARQHPPPLKQIHLLHQNLKSWRFFFLSLFSISPPSELIRDRVFHHHIYTCLFKSFDKQPQRNTFHPRKSAKWPLLMPVSPFLKGPCEGHATKVSH